MKTNKKTTGYGLHQKISRQAGKHSSAKGF